MELPITQERTKVLPHVTVAALQKSLELGFSQAHNQTFTLLLSIATSVQSQSTLGRLDIEACRFWSPTWKAWVGRLRLPNMCLHSLHSNQFCCTSWKFATTASSQTPSWWQPLSYQYLELKLCPTHACWKQRLAWQHWGNASYARAEELPVWCKRFFLNDVSLCLSEASTNGQQDSGHCYLPYLLGTARAQVDCATKGGLRQALPLYRQLFSRFQWGRRIKPQPGAELSFLPLICLGKSFCMESVQGVESF